MYKISFIGNLNQSAEFASRWREKLVPDQVAAGKLVAKYQYEGDAPKLDALYNRVSKEGRQIRTKLNIDKTPIISEDYNNRIYKSEGKQSISATGKEKLKELKTAYKKRKFTANIGKAKNFIGKNKLGIGLAGATALGGIGYGITRKMRSDKGKKRGFYNR